MSLRLLSAAALAGLFFTTAFVTTAFVSTGVVTIAFAEPHAGHHGGHAASPYAGQEARAIKSLSDEDLAELRKGGGWGLAKAAELNGVPGPAHLLEMRKEIDLSAAQVAAIEAIFSRMQADAITEGERLIAFEAALEAEFRTRSVTLESLDAALARIEESRRKLRYIHLSAHLASAPHLSDEQVARYNTLRGYGTDPCASVPAGHDPAVWRRHNRCN